MNKRVSPAYKVVCHVRVASHLPVSIHWYYDIFSLLLALWPPATSGCIDVSWSAPQLSWLACRAANTTANAPNNKTAVHVCLAIQKTLACVLHTVFDMYMLLCSSEKKHVTNYMAHAHICCCCTSLYRPPIFEARAQL